MPLKTTSGKPTEVKPVAKETIGTTQTPVAQSSADLLESDALETIKVTGQKDARCNIYCEGGYSF